MLQDMIIIVVVVVVEVVDVVVGKNSLIIATIINGHNSLNYNEPSQNEKKQEKEKNIHIRDIKKI